MRNRFDSSFTLAASTLTVAAMLAACGGGDASAPSSTGLTAQSISFSPATTGTAGTSLTLSATASSGLAVTFSSATTSTCTVNGTTLSLLTAGTCTVNAIQNGDSTFAAASQVSRDITVSAASTSATTIATFDESPAATLSAFEGAEFVPFQDNGSNVAKLIKRPSSNPWAGATLLTCPAGTDGATPAIPFTSEHQSISVMVKAPRAGVVFTLKAEGVGSNSGAPVFAQTINTGTGWEKLTFNLSNKTNGTTLDVTKVYNQFSIFPNWTEVTTDTLNRDGESEDSEYLFDNFKFEGVTATLAPCPPSQAPTTASAAPTATPVVTVFSDATGYTPPSGVNWTFRTDWSLATYDAAATVAGSGVLKYTSFTVVGIEPTNATLDVTSAAYVNLDVWTPNLSEFRIKLVDFGADAGYGGGDDTEHQVTVDMSNHQGQWRRIRLALSDFSALAARNHIKQIIFSKGDTDGPGTVFVDNVFFSSN